MPHFRLNGLNQARVVSGVMMSVANSVELPECSAEVAPEARSDDELMELAAAGQRAAFERLVLRYQRHVRQVCARLCGNAAHGDDLAQDVFASLWQLRQCYEARGRFKSYLFTIAVSRCKNWRRDQRRSWLRAEPPENLTTEPNQFDELALIEHRRRLNECVAKLPPEQCAAIALKFGADLDTEQIAQILVCPEATVRSRVFFGIARLRMLTRKWGQP